MFMTKKKPTVVSLLGARPQFIKLAPLAGRLSDKFRHIVIHSGQHYDNQMSDVFFKQLKLPKPKFNLAVGSGSHAEMTSAIMKRFEESLFKIKADFVLVYGDTNTTLAGALTASKMHIPLGHVEAGLRSFNMDMPEEINRRLADCISSLLFCPTRHSIENLRSEGIKKGVIHSGDLMYELIDANMKKIKSGRAFLDRIGLKPKNYVFMTTHRAGNVDVKGNLEKIIEVIKEVKEQVVFPMHPRTVKNLKSFKLYSGLKRLANLMIIEPVAYIESLTLMHFARAVLTDSGGVQKESIFLGTPCLTLRDETEWVETLKWGNHLVGLSAGKAVSILNSIDRRTRKIPFKIRRKKPSEIITQSLTKFLL